MKTVINTPLASVKPSHFWKLFEEDEDSTVVALGVLHTANASDEPEPTKLVVYLELRDPSDPQAYGVVDIEFDHERATVLTASQTNFPDSNFGWTQPRGKRIEKTIRSIVSNVALALREPNDLITDVEIITVPEGWEDLGEFVVLPRQPAKLK